MDNAKWKPVSLDHDSIRLIFREIGTLDRVRFPKLEKPVAIKSKTVYK